MLKRNQLNRCSRLDSDGKQCRNAAIFAIKYHGDNELYHETEVGWVKIGLCKKHGGHTIFSLSRESQ